MESYPLRHLDALRLRTPLQPRSQRSIPYAQRDLSIRTETCFRKFCNTDMSKRPLLPGKLYILFVVFLVFPVDERLGRGQTTSVDRRPWFQLRGFQLEVYCYLNSHFWVEMYFLPCNLFTRFPLYTSNTLNRIRKNF